MKRFVGGLWLAAIALAGCESKQDPVAPESETFNLFTEGKGVRFSDQTRNLFDLEIVNVAERRMKRSRTVTAQVYRATDAGNLALATALLSAEETVSLTIGQPVGLKAPGSGAEFIGRLIGLDAHGHPALGHVEALIAFADPGRRCPAGMFLTATFDEGAAGPALVVPQSALLAAADGAYVYTVNGTHLTRTRVRAGTASDGFVEIKEGLYAGDSVAAKGVENLWLVELSALKGGKSCCPVPDRNGEK